MCEAVIPRCPLTHSPIHLLTHSLTHPLTHSLTHTHTHIHKVYVRQKIPLTRRVACVTCILLSYALPAPLFEYLQWQFHGQWPPRGGIGWRYTPGCYVVYGGVTPRGVFYKRYKVLIIQIVYSWPPWGVFCYERPLPAYPNHVPYPGVGGHLIAVKR